MSKQCMLSGAYYPTVPRLMNGNQCGACGRVVKLYKPKLSNRSGVYMPRHNKPVAVPVKGGAQ